MNYETHPTKIFNNSAWVLTIILNLFGLLYFSFFFSASPDMGENIFVTVASLVLHPAVVCLCCISIISIVSNNNYSISPYLHFFTVLSHIIASILTMRVILLMSKDPSSDIGFWFALFPIIISILLTRHFIKNPGNFNNSNIVFGGLILQFVAYLVFFTLR